MIRPSFALKLARTKLRSKRGVLVTSIIIASLLFATLITTVIVFTGAEKSALEFIKKAGNNRYLVMVSPNIPYEKVDFVYKPPIEDIRAIKAFEKQYYIDLQNKYKSLGLEYDKSIEVSALIPDAAAPETVPEEQRVRINWASPVIDLMRNDKFEVYAKTATNKLSDLKAIASEYDAGGYYAVDKQSFIPSIPGLRLVQQNKESFGDSELKTGNSTSRDFYINAIYNSTYGFTDQNLLNRYLLTTDSSNLRGVPVVVSAQEAVSLFGQKVGIGKEPEAVHEKRAWLNEIQTKLNGHIYQACYRNTTEQILLEKIQRDYAEMKSSKGTENYQKPHLIYGYPENACGDIVVKEDTRTSIEKQADAKAEEIKKKLGTYIAPNHKLVTFQIVGIKYAQENIDYSADISQYVKSLLVSEVDSFNLSIPIQMYDSLPSELKVDDIQREYDTRTLRYAVGTEDFGSRVLEFAAVEDAQSFLDNETCPLLDTDCDRNFLASPYGSNYLILDEIGKLFGRIANVAFPVALTFAAVIIWFTISRIMAENRKETAVYRAMGAKRFDVISIYVTYVLLVALQIALVSIVLGITAAFIIEYVYGKVLTDTAVSVFGIVDNAPKFSLFSLDSPLLPFIIGSIFIISLVASIQPLIRNVLRPPIRDIRDE